MTGQDELATLRLELSNHENSGSNGNKYAVDHLHAAYAVAGYFLSFWTSTQISKRTLALLGKVFFCLSLANGVFNLRDAAPLFAR